MSLGSELLDPVITFPAMAEKNYWDVNAVFWQLPQHLLCIGRRKGVRPLSSEIYALLKGSLGYGRLERF
jgi:hypothetical protein